MPADTDSYIGQISVVVQTDVGSSLIQDALLGDTTLYFEDATEFDENGGQFTLNGETYTYDTADMETDSVHIVTGLVQDELTGEIATVYPKLINRYAAVTIPGFDDPVVATVPFSIAAQLPVGSRTPELAETVLIEHTAADWIISDVLSDPTIDGGFLDPPTVPIPPGLTPDGIPPALSPDPTVQGGIGFLIVKWSPITNHDFVRYEVHVSLTSGFSPDATTRVGETVGSQFTIRKLPDDTPLDYGTDTNPTEYFVRILAYDVDGYAQPSAEAAGVMVRVTGPDIAADSIFANNIVAGNITGDLFAASLLLSSLIKTAETGSRVEIDSAGIRLYAPDGGTILINLPTTGDPIIISGQLSTNALHVYGQADFDAETSFGKDSVTTIEGGQQQPPATPLTVTPSWVIPFNLPTGMSTDRDDVVFARYDAIFYDPDGYGHDPTFICLAYADDDDQTLYLLEISATDGQLLRHQEAYSAGPNLLVSVDDIVGYAAPTFSKHSYWDIGCARAGSFVYVLVAASGRLGAGIRVISFDQSTFEWTGIVSNATNDIPGGGAAAWLGCDNNDNPSTASPVIAYKTNGGSAIVRVYGNADANLGSDTDTIVTSGKTYTGDAIPWGVTLSAATSSLRLAWANGASGTQTSAHNQAVNEYNQSSGAFRGAGHNFQNGVQNVWAGVAWDGTRFYTSDGYRLFQHASQEWQSPDADQTYWVAYAWSDGLGHETQPSPSTSTQIENFAYMGLSFSPWTAAAAAGWNARVYAGVGNAPGPADYQFQTAITYPATSLLLDGLLAAPFALPPVNNFPSAGSGGELKTGGAGFSLRGDGKFILPQFPTNTRNAAPAEGEYFYDSTLHMVFFWTGRRWVPVETGGRALRGLWSWYEDFMEGDPTTQFGPLMEATANGGSTLSEDVDRVHPGVRRLSTGSNVDGRAYIRTATNCMKLGNGVIHYTACFSIPTLSTSAQRFKVFIGLRDDPGAAGLPTNGILLRYTDNNASGVNQIEYVTVDAGVDNGGVDSGVTAVAGRWYRFDIYVNAAASTVDFYIDDGAHQPVTSFIPGVPLGYMAGIEKTVGVNSRAFLLDFLGAQGELQTTR